MNWLITGGCGFIGLNLVKDLILEGGHYVRIVDNLSVGTREDLSRICQFTEIDKNILNFQPSILNSYMTQSSSASSLQPNPNAMNAELSTMPGKVDLIVADILDAELALKAAKEIDVIVHLAANTGVASSVKDPRSDCLINVIGTLYYLEAARRNNVKRFIFASSGAPVGECEPPIHEEVAPHPVSPYGASKLAGEGYCSAYFKTFGIETVALRFGNVYGPLSNHKNSVVAKFIKLVIEGKPLEIYGDGDQTRDFIYIDDLIRAIRLSSISKDVEGEIFQIATNVETTISEVARKVVSVMSDFGYNNIQVHYTDFRVGDVRRNFSDTAKAQRILNWHAEIEIEEGFERTLRWFLDKHL